MNQAQPATIPELLNTGMGPKLHWLPDHFSISELAAILVGMANTEGGTILVGVAPRSAQIQGVTDPDDTIDRVFQAALLVDPPLVLPFPQTAQVERFSLVRITVPPGLPHVYNLEGRFLNRVEHRTSAIPPKDLRRLLMKRGLVQFETGVPPGAVLDDLNIGLIQTYLNAINVSELEPWQDVLVRRGCLKFEDGALRPTYAAILLFGHAPQQWLPSSTIMAARFPGEAVSDEFIKHELRGSLIDQLRGAETFVRDNLRTVARLSGLTRQETPEYPLEAVRELLVNAVAHRDYNQQGDSVHLHIFANRLEVHSPGGLPGPVNLENLLEARFSRNAVIAQILSDFGFVERLGYGLNRVMTVVQQHGLPNPVFQETSGSFRVTLRAGNPPQIAPQTVQNLSAYAQYNLNPRQELAIGHLVTRGRITNRRYQALCPDVSPETLRRDLADLVKKGLLIRVGSKKATYYILKK